jgi:hypothetical protein
VAALDDGFDPGSVQDQGGVGVELQRRVPKVHTGVAVQDDTINEDGMRRVVVVEVNFRLI